MSCKNISQIQVLIIFLLLISLLLSFMSIQDISFLSLLTLIIFQYFKLSGDYKIISADIFNKPAMTNYIKPIRKMKVVRHLLSLKDINRKTSTLIKNSERIIACGILVGDFYENKSIKFHEEIQFIANFDGFFQVDKDWSGQQLLYFQGRITDILLISINDNEFDERIMQFSESLFTGYFKGVFWKCQYNFLRHPKLKLTSLSDLQSRQWIRVKQEEHLLIPCFTRFTIQNIISLNRDKNIAHVSGILTIELQFNEQLKNLFALCPLSLTLLFNRDYPLLIPLSEHRSVNDNDDEQSQVLVNYFEQKHVMIYKIKKIFVAEIDSTYNQFFAPFNLISLKIIFKMLDTTFKMPSKYSYKQNETKSSSLRLKFINLTLQDTLKDNPYEDYNSLIDSNRLDLASNRLTKISLSLKAECGEYIIATNLLSLFPYHSFTLYTVSSRSQNSLWNTGFISKSSDICQPKVLSIKQAFQQKQYQISSKKSTPTKLFRISTWNNVHIEIPIYKYWMVNTIQIVIPLFILSGLSLLIFFQEKGEKTDETSTLNLRILNAASIMIAYVALIPLIRQNAPRAVNVSFLYVIIYLSMIPNLLALISGIVDQNILNSQWKKSYRAFKDILFLISFCLTCAFISVIVLVTIFFIKSSYTSYQVKKLTLKNKNKFKDVIDPFGFQLHIDKIKEKRKNQFIFTQFDDLSGQF